MKAKTFSAVLCALFAMAAFAAQPEPLPIGAEAPDFELPGVDGKTYTLDDFADAEVLAIIFTCNHCPTAQGFEDRIQALHDDYKDKGAAIVAVSPNDPLAVRLDELGYTDLNDSLEDMKLRAEDHNFTFPYLYDGETQEMSMKYGPAATPHAFVFGPDRKLRYIGHIEDAEDPAKVKSRPVRDAIDALLAGEEVPVKKTRVFGCSTKWSDKRPTVKAALERWAKEEVSLQPIDIAGAKELMANDTENYRLINLWATWCGPCVAEMPDLVEINRMYRGRNFEFITISMDEPEAADKALAFLKENEASATNYHYTGDDKFAFMDHIDPEWEGAIPHTILVAPGGKITYRHTGQVDPLELKRAIVGKLGRTYF